MGVTAPNWLMIIGYTYCGIGVALIAGAIGAAMIVSGAGDGARSRQGASQACLAAFGAALVTAGYLLQASASTTTLALSGHVALLLLGLMSAMILFGLARIAYIGNSGEADAEPDFAAATESTYPAPATVAEKLAAPVKLVSSN